ncbi:MAG: HDOD domain-containing protein [Bacillota bacterium]|jgi:c-di-GMP-related signal transduction protein|nr:HDOD domain-containing protein [Bacillota bacterium]NLH88251.1 HDOD domain-containing protein [Bacillota bacterium]
MTVFIARQPIFDVLQRIQGYELLFRSSDINAFPGISGDKASVSVLDTAFMSIGIEQLTGGKRASINFTDELLRQSIPTALPREIVIIEILESVRPDEAVLEACRTLRNKGYTLALDDFKLDGPLGPLAPLADIIKVDFLCTPLEQCKAIATDPELSHASFLAEKVETREVFRDAVEMGYTYFQGYFFAKPEVTSGRSIPPQKLTHMQLIAEASRPNPDADRVTDIVSHDLALSYRLLRLVNSAAFGLRTRVSSVRHAILLLGPKEIERWISVLALMNLADGKPDALVTVPVLRGRFAELLAPAAGLGEQSTELFLVGLFSMLDALLDSSMAKALSYLPLAPAITDALLGEPGPFGDILELVKYYEMGDWESASQCGAKLGLEESVIMEAYIEAAKWANDCATLT